ncbi:hypothetical protein Tco_0740841 [Tanacetum coccineum]
MIWSFMGNNFSTRYTVQDPDWATLVCAFANFRLECFILSIYRTRCDGVPSGTKTMDTGSDQVDGNVEHYIERHQKHNAALLLCSTHWPFTSVSDRAQKDADELKLKVIELEHKVNMLKEVMSDRAEEKQKAISQVILTLKSEFLTVVTKGMLVRHVFVPSYDGRIVRALQVTDNSIWDDYDLEASPSSPQNPKTFQPKNKSLVAEIFDWDEKEVSEDEKVTQVKVLMALADDELIIRKSHARNCEWVDITIRKVNTLLSMDEDADWQNYLKYININIKFVEEQRLNLLSKYNKIVFELNKCRDELISLKQAKLDAVTFQIQNTQLTKLNHALQEQL